MPAELETSWPTPLSVPCQNFNPGVFFFWDISQRCQPWREVDFPKPGDRSRTMPQTWVYVGQLEGTTIKAANLAWIMVWKKKKKKDRHITGHIVLFACMEFVRDTFAVARGRWRRWWPDRLLLPRCCLPFLPATGRRGGQLLSGRRVTASEFFSCARKYSATAKSCFACLKCALKLLTAIELRPRERISYRWANGKRWKSRVAQNTKFLAPGFCWFYLCACYWVNGLKIYQRSMSHHGKKAG